MSSNYNTTKDLPEAEIVLYDLASTKGVCFSPAVWRIRLLLNYKEIPYRTIWLEFPDIKEELVKLWAHLLSPFLIFPIFPLLRECAS